MKRDSERLEPLKCQSCGAPLIEAAPGLYKCEHCGSVYKDPEINCYPTSFVQIQRPGVMTIRAETAISRHELAALGAEDLTKFTLEQLRQQLAEGLIAAMRIDKIEDYRRNMSIIRGTVRVVPPDFRF